MEAVTEGYRPTRITTKRTANVAPVEKVSTLKRVMEWARWSIRGLPVRAPQACNTGAARANPTNSSAQNMCTSIVKPVIKRMPPTAEKASERSNWARRCRLEVVATPTLNSYLDFPGSFQDRLPRLASAGSVQGCLVDGPGLQPPVNYVVRRAAALHGLPYRPQQPPLARRGEDKHLPELELLVPGVRLLLGRLHLHKYRVDPDPR